MIDPARPDFGDTPASDRRPVFKYALADASAAPCVSIVTPFRNTGPVFHETVRSVHRQSLQQWEWVIVNDGSDDPASLAMLYAVAAADPRIRILDLPGGGGVSAARNAGFAAARTPFVFQLDSDDLLEPTTLEKCWWLLESHPEVAFVKGFNVGFGAQEYLAPHGFHDGPLFLERNPTAITSMVRRHVHAAVGGYDETNRDGLEDWEFWLACASAGFWGTTIPEYLDWYRRRDDHGVRWSNWDAGGAQDRFAARLRQRYPRLWEPGGFPAVAPPRHPANASVPDDLPGTNPLARSAPRLLMILPWLTMGGADKFNLDLAEQLAARGWEITIATTLPADHSWLPQFTRRTPDVFVLHRFLRLVDYPRFLKYLLGSRRPDVVMVSNSELGYMLLPYLRAAAPGAAFVDLTHMEEEHWKSGGYPRLALTHQESLDANLTVSAHLRGWMAERGGDAARTIVCHGGVALPPAAEVDAARARVRRELGIADGTPVILYAGRLCDQKQPLVFAETIRRLVEQGAVFTALVAGTGPDARTLEAFIGTHRLEARVRLLGAVPPEGMSGLMSACDVFFLPSQWEGIAFAIYEAMAHGRPVVGADVGGQKELLTPECGTLVSAAVPADAQARRYAEVLAGLLRDAPARRRMGEAARRRIEESFTVRHMADRFVEAFERAAALRTEAPRALAPANVARTCATYAIEHTRLTQVADDLWVRQMSLAAPMPAVAALPTWRRYVLRGCAALEPAYAWGLQRGWRWLVPLRHRLRGVVVDR